MAEPGLFGQAVAATQPQYGQLTGYTPIPGYGYEFETAGGGKRKMPATPSADAAARAIDAARAYQPGAGPLAPPPAAPAEPTRFDPLASAKGGGEIGVRAGGDPSNPMDYIVRTPGQAARAGGMAARGMTTQGGYDLDPGRLDAIQQAQEEIQGAYQSSAVEAHKAAAERQAYFQAAREQASKEAVEQVRENTMKQQGIDDLSARYNQVEKEFLEMPEKQRAARESQKGKTFAENLMMAFGTLGATLAKTPNFVAQTIENNRERELRREEAELRVKKEAKDSLLGRLRDEMGSMELAKTAFRAIRTRQDALALEQSAAKTGDVQRQQEILQVAAVQNQGYQKWLEELERGKQGQVTKTFQYVPGQAGSRGGYRAPTIEELKGLQELRAGEAGIGKTQADTAKSLAAADPNKPAHLGQRAQGTIVAARNARTAIAEAATALGISRDKESGEYQDPTWATAAVSKVPYSGTRQKMNALRLTMIAEVGKAQTGGALTEAEAHEMKGQIDDANTPGELGALLRHYDHTMHSVEKNVRSVAGSSGPGSDTERDDEGHP